MRWRMASRIKPPPNNRAFSGGRRTRARIALLLSPPLFLIGVWMRVAFRLLTTSSDIDTHSRSSPSSSHDPATVVVVVGDDAARAAGRPSTIDERPRVAVERKRRLVSRDPGVIVTSSTRGNLGPPSVLNQDPPGEDWIGDRWQAASDMGGTAIPGRHWILVDFSSSSSSVFVSKIVLDWETAYAEDYRVEGRLDPPPLVVFLLPAEGGGGGARPRRVRRRRRRRMVHPVRRRHPPRRRRKERCRRRQSRRRRSKDDGGIRTVPRRKTEDAASRRSHDRLDDDRGGEGRGLRRRWTLPSIAIPARVHSTAREGLGRLVVAGGCLRGGHKLRKRGRIIMCWMVNQS